MTFGTLLRAFDAVIAFTEVARGFKSPRPPGDTPGAAPATTDPAAALQTQAAQVEARLTGVVVAALKEAFNRDHARLELERAQLEEQKRRADEALKAELRRQAAERELGRLRLIAATAMVGWLASVIMLMIRSAAASGLSKGALAVGWVLLLGSLGASFTAQGRVGAEPSSESASTAAVWLMVAGLAVTAISLLL